MNSFIRICNPSRCKIQSSGVFVYWFQLTIVKFTFHFKQWWGCMQSTYQPVPFYLAVSLGKIYTTFPTEELVLIERIKSSQASSFNTPNFMISSSRSISPSMAFSYSSWGRISSMPDMDTYFLVAFYSPSAFHAKENFRTNFLAWKFNNMNTLFFIWHFLKKILWELTLTYFQNYLNFNSACGVSYRSLISMLEHPWHFGSQYFKLLV